MGRVISLTAFSICLFLTTAAFLCADDDDQAKEALWLADHAKLVNKIDTLVVGDVDFKDATIDQILDFLRKRSKEVDPDHQGINFVADRNFQPELNAIKFKVHLKNATVADVLHSLPYVTSSAGDFVVELWMESEEGLCRRTFLITDNTLAINPSMLLDKDKLTYDVRPLFEAKGIKFPLCTSAIYDLPAKKLIVTQDAESLIRIDELLVYGFKNIK